MEIERVGEREGGSGKEVIYIVVVRVQGDGESR